MRYLLTLLLVMGMMPPVYAFDAFEGVAEKVAAAKAHAKMIAEHPNLSTEEKLFGLTECFVDQVQKTEIENNVISWLIDGISRALGASPLAIRDSIPSNMENADIPEYLVRQLLNMDAMKRTQDEVVGAPKKPPVLYLGIKLTQEEVRRISNSDDMINFVINHEDRVFFQVQK